MNSTVPLPAEHAQSAQPMNAGAISTGARIEAIADALISLRNEEGTEFTALSDDRGYYRIRATTGEVVMTAAKDGYKTRESRFDVTDSTVLNFSLAPIAP